MKLHIGCGHVIKDGWVNHDVANLPGVDVVHDLNQFPWPWKDQAFDEVYMKDVLEHLDDVIKVMEELHRITEPGAKVFIAVPYWNSWEAVTDPTHKNQFNEFTLQFFDPTHWRCKDRPYYSTARFKIKNQHYIIKIGGPHLKIPVLGRVVFIKNRLLKKIVGILASYFSNIIIGLDIYLERT